MPDRHRALTWFAAATLLYLVTGAPGPIWADSSKLVLYALHHYLPSLNPGDHPGWTAVADAWLAVTGWLGPSRALAGLSALAGGAAVGEMFALVRRLTGDEAGAHTAAALLLVAHPLWWAATIPETYALAVAAALAAALAATGEDDVRHAAVAGLLSGVALSVHAFSVVLTAPFLLRPLRRRALPTVAAGALGTAPLWLAFFGFPADPLTGYRAAGAASVAWHFGAFIDPARALTGAVFVCALLAFAFGPLGAVGLLRGLRRRRPAVGRPVLLAVLLAALAGLLAVYSPYRVHLMVVFVVVGAMLLVPPRLSRRQRIAHVAVQSLLYVTAAAAAQLSGHGDLGIRVLPDRSNAWYFLSPVRTFTTGPRHYAAALLDALPADTLLLADFNPGAVLRLEQETRGLRRDVEVVPRSVNDALATRDPAAALARDIRAGLAAGRPVALADSYEPYYRIAALEKRYGYRFTPCGPGLLVSAPVAPRPPDDSSAPPPPAPPAPRR